MDSTREIELRRRSIGDQTADRPPIMWYGLWLIVAAGLLAAGPQTMLEVARASDGMKPATLKQRGASGPSATPTKRDAAARKNDAAQKDNAVQQRVAKSSSISCDIIASGGALRNGRRDSGARADRQARGSRAGRRIGADRLHRRTLARNPPHSAGHRRSPAPGSGPDPHVEEGRDRRRRRLRPVRLGPRPVGFYAKAPGLSLRRQTLV